MPTISENIQTIATDINSIKTNLGLSSNASLDDVVTKSESVIEPTGTISITSNGTTDVTNYASANVNVAPVLQSKSVTITENTTQTVSADSGYDGLSSVTITTNVSGGGGGPITQEEYNIDEELARSILEDFTPYTELEYIQSTGTQYIDTLYYPTQNTKLVMKMETLGIVQGTTAFNAFGTAGTDSRFGWWTYYSGTSYFRYGIQSSSRDSKIDVSGDYTNTLFTVTLDSTIAKIETPSQTLQYSVIPTSNFTLDVSLVIGGHHWSNGASIGQCGAIYKLYYCKIYENDVLIKDYIPVKNRINDEICLYDNVNEEFLYNGGTGYYIPGGVVNANVTA